MTTGQLQLFVAKFGYKAEANTDLLDITRLGTGIIWKSELPVSEVTSVVDCRAQLAKIGPYHLLNIYAPSGSSKKTVRRDFFGQDIFRLIRGANTLNDVVTGFNYSDACRLFKPNFPEYTFHRQNCAPYCLDRFYVPPFCVPYVQAFLHHASLSDHHHGVLIVNLPDLVSAPKAPKRPALYWKLSTNILEDEDFLENFQDLYSKIQGKIEDFPDIADWWDLCVKPAIRNFCMGVSERLVNL